MEKQKRNKRVRIKDTFSGIVSEYDTYRAADAALSVSFGTVSQTIHRLAGRSSGLIAKRFLVIPVED